MTTTAKATPTIAPAFPVKDIEACIRDYLELEGDMQAELHGRGGAIGPQPVIDSLVVVSVLCELEPKVPFDLPDSLVRAGGYNSVDETVQHLMPQLQKRWRRHYEGST